MNNQIFILLKYQRERTGWETYMKNCWPKLKKNVMENLKQHSKEILQLIQDKHKKIIPRHRIVS